MELLNIYFKIIMTNMLKLKTFGRELGNIKISQAEKLELKNRIKEKLSGYV